MKVYYDAISREVFDYLPLTYHITEGVSDGQFAKFEETFKNPAKNPNLARHPLMGKDLWIVKPGENTNRGCGITVCKDLAQIRGIVSNANANERSYIIQKYCERPLLYKNRKCDIRCFAMTTTVNGNLQAYFYQEGYLRTSCREYSLKNVQNRLIHLTNDAV